MSKRNAVDPLVRKCLELYGLNFLQVPRANADVGDCWMEKDGDVLPPGKLASLVDSRFVLPRVTRGEIFQIAEENFSRALDVAAGLSLTDRLLSGIGVTGFSGKARAELEAKNAKQVRVKIDGATRDAVDLFELDEALDKVLLKEIHSGAAKSGRIFCSVAVVRATGITLRAEDKDNERVTLEGEISQLGGAKLNIGKSQLGDLRLEYTGPTALVFGVELTELEATPDGKLRVKGVAPAREIRNAKGFQEVQPLRRLVGDEKNGDIFVDLYPSAVGDHRS